MNLRKDNGGKIIGNIAPKLSSKFAPYLRNLVSHEEIGEIADWLVKYARSCALDAKINIDFNGNI